MKEVNPSPPRRWAKDALQIAEETITVIKTFRDWEESKKELLQRIDHYGLMSYDTEGYWGSRPGISYTQIGAPGMPGRHPKRPITYVFDMARTRWNPSFKQGLPKEILARMADDETVVTGSDIWLDGNEAGITLNRWVDTRRLVVRYADIDFLKISGSYRRGQCGLSIVSFLTGGMPFKPCSAKEYEVKFGMVPADNPDSSFTKTVYNWRSGSLNDDQKIYLMLETASIFAMYAQFAFNVYNSLPKMFDSEHMTISEMISRIVSVDEEQGMLSPTEDQGLVPLIKRYDTESLNGHKRKASQSTVRSTEESLEGPKPSKTSKSSTSSSERSSRSRDKKEKKSPRRSKGEPLKEFRQRSKLRASAPEFTPSPTKENTGMRSSVPDIFR